VHAWGSTRLAENTAAPNISVMDANSTTTAQRHERFEHLAQALGKYGWISEGSVQDRGAGAGGPHYQWTRRVNGRTLSVALSEEQYHWLKAAVANWRKLQATLKEMQRLTYQEMFNSLPEPKRRKPLSKKVLDSI
jgi:cyclopropane fatty-acyl-phospholipid synthase-like methyltransferase